MKIKIILVSIVLLLVIVFASGCIPFMEKLGLVSPTKEEQLSPEKGGLPDGLVKVLIGFKEKPGPAEQALVSGLGGEIYRQFTIVNVIAAGMTQEAADALAKNIKVKYVEPDGPVYALEQTVPWGIDRVFGDESYSFDTWVITRGDGIAVAVIDTGIDVNHEDLIVAGGVRFRTTGPFLRQDDNYDDDNGHGTHVAGTIAALDNDCGVVGIGPKIYLYAVKVLDASGSGSVSSVVAGIEWAVEKNIPILNMSLGSSTHSQTLQDTCDTAYFAGNLLVAAAGNSGLGEDTVSYPAKYSSVIAVAASDINDGRASFSSTGPDVELIAPGVNVLSTWKDNGYREASGTSMASPHVAGAAALAWSANSSLSNQEVRFQLQDTAEDLGLSSSHQGHGLVRADLVVRAVSGIVPPANGNIEGTVKDKDVIAIEGATVVVEGTSLSATTGEDGYYLLENVPIGNQEVTASADSYYSETATVTVVEDGTVTQDFVLQAIPTYTVSGTVTDTEGNALGDAAVIIKETDQSATTVSDGTYSISDVKKGTYDITASKSGYTSETKTVTVDSDTTVNFALAEITEEAMYVNSITFAEKRYGPGGSFIDLMTTVEVLRSSDDQPVSDARVEMNLKHEKGSWDFAGNTNSNGKVTFTLKRAYTGDYTATVTKVTHGVYVWDTNKGVTSAKYTVK